MRWCDADDTISLAMFAVVTISGKQYKVSVGDTIVVDQIDGKVGSVVTFDHVLLSSDGKKTTVGKPTLKKVVVSAKILAHQKGEKIQVRRFKSKVRYRRSVGFRARQTKLEIVKISTSS